MGWEVHHKRKKDSPSGTALTLARIVTGRSERKTKVVTERLDRAPAPDELHFASVRGGEEPGHAHGAPGLHVRHHRAHAPRAQPRRLRPGRRARGGMAGRTRRAFSRSTISSRTSCREREAHEARRSLHGARHADDRGRSAGRKGAADGSWISRSRAACSGLVPVGTTGESPTLDGDECKRVIQVVVEQARGRVPVIAGAGSNSTARPIQYARDAKEVGANATLQVAPYYNKPTNQGFLGHFRAIADAVDLPLVVYNIAGRHREEHRQPHDAGAGAAPEHRRR